MNVTHVVAIAELSGPIESAVSALAVELGTTAYELRLTLGGGFPAVVLATSDGDRATAVARAIAARGHRAFACDRAQVVSSARMTVFRDFQLGAAGVIPGPGSPEVLPYGDIVALLRAAHRSTTETTTEIKEKKLRPGMALATGGLVMTKTTTREVTSRSEDREQVLYLFRRSGSPPWILREKAGRYAGLGAELGRTTLENFAATVKKLRALAPGAAYDERLQGARPIRGVAEGADAVDLLAHLLAADLTRPR
jgi:hypothetical protein